jgi:hypothetical protein
MDWEDTASVGNTAINSAIVTTSRIAAEAFIDTRVLNVDVCPVLRTSTGPDTVGQ